MLGFVPVEDTLLDDVAEGGLVRKEEGQVGGENAVADHTQDLLVLGRRQRLEHVVALLFSKFINFSEYFCKIFSIFIYF
jgi:hypothetical protein